MKKSVIKSYKDKKVSFRNSKGNLFLINSLDKDYKSHIFIIH